MNRKILIIPIVVIIGIFLINFGSNQTLQDNYVVFHVTLADPSLYSDGVYRNSFFIDEISLQSIVSIKFEDFINILV